MPATHKHGTKLHESLNFEKLLPIEVHGWIELLCKCHDLLTLSMQTEPIALSELLAC